jgi:hypothetical protein
MAEPTSRRDDPDERARRAEAALEAVISERNRLWDELHRRKADEREAAYYRELYHQVVTSRSWRITVPLRRTKWFVQQIPELGRRLRRFLSHCPQAPT